MSASNLAYHLRVNKHIDRRLFMEAVGMAAQALDFSVGAYGYVSMGGSFLEDFRSVHQRFGIVRMYSFDASESVISRQRVNRPFGFVTCKARTSGEVVEDFDGLRAELGGGNVIVWLDYTAPKHRQRQLVEVEELAKKLVPGDVFRVTLNANRASLGSNEEFERLKFNGQTACTSLWEYRYDRLMTEFGSQVPDERKSSEFLRKDQGFRETLARCVKEAALRGVGAHDTLRIEPILSACYSDGTDMITVTAVVLTHPQSDRLRTHQAWRDWPHKPGVDWDEFVEIKVPPLSQHERHLIHQAMNATQDGVAVGVIHFTLDDSESEHNALLEQYRLHYDCYPTFALLEVV